MEYRSISDNIGIITGFNNIGIIKNGSNTILIDSGLEERAAKNICRILSEKGLIPVAIINTHSHADHCGGNNYIQNNYNIDIVSSLKESIFIENPCLEPYCFFSGSKPLNELENKFLQATPSKATKIVQPGEKEEFNGIELTFHSLAGHSIDQIGIGVEDVLFCGDAFFSDYVLEKYKLPFLVDLDKFIATLEYLKKTDYRVYIPAHGEPTEDIKTVADLHMAKLKKIEGDILALLDGEKTTEELLQEIFSLYRIRISGPQQYYLLKTAVMAYLSSLTNRGVVKTGLKGNILSWNIN